MEPEDHLALDDSRLPKVVLVLRCRTFSRGGAACKTNGG